MYLLVETIKLQSQQEASNEEVAAALADDRNVVQQNLMMQDLPIPRVEASFDMGWQVRSSGGKYGSFTGHALLIGARTRKVLDSAIYNKKCGVCTKHEKRTGNTTNVRNHLCVKNYNGSSKSMEAAALVKMLIRVPEEKNISVCTIISDDDSNARAKARHESNGGILPLTVEEPQFKADPGICKGYIQLGKCICKSEYSKERLSNTFEILLQSLCQVIQAPHSRRVVPEGLQHSGTCNQ